MDESKKKNNKVFDAGSLHNNSSHMVKHDCFHVTITKVPDAVPWFRGELKGGKKMARRQGPTKVHLLLVVGRRNDCIILGVRYNRKWK